MGRTKLHLSSTMQQLSTSGKHAPHTTSDIPKWYLYIMENTSVVKRITRTWKDSQNSSHRKENKLMSSQDNKDDSKHVKEMQEVENVGQKENMTRGMCPEGETQQPPEQGLGALPQPPPLFDFGGREQETNKYGGGDDGHREVVEHGNGSQWNRSATLKKQG